MLRRKIRKCRRQSSRDIESLHGAVKRRPQWLADMKLPMKVGVLTKWKSGGRTFPAEENALLLRALNCNHAWYVWRITQRLEYLVGVQVSEENTEVYITYNSVRRYDFNLNRGVKSLVYVFIKSLELLCWE